MLHHIPSIIGFITCVGISYFISVVNLSRPHLALAILALVVAYVATVIWYIRTTK